MIDRKIYIYILYIGKKMFRNLSFIQNFIVFIFNTKHKIILVI